MSDITRKPCPRHPEQGDIAWVTFLDTRRPEVEQEPTPMCVLCMAGDKPAGRPEFAQ